LQALQENKEKNEAEENKKEVRDMLLHFFEKEYELHSSATLYRNDLYANVFSQDTSSLLSVVINQMSNRSLNIKGAGGNYTTYSESQIKENMFMFLEKAFLDYLKQNPDFKNKFEKVCKEYAPDDIAEITLSDELPNKLPEREPLFKKLYLTSRLYLHNKGKNKISLSETTYADFFVSYIFKILYNNKDEDLYKAYNRFNIQPTKQKPQITILKATTDKNGKLTLLTLEFLNYYNKIKL
jgi:hypothetical protein